MAEEPLDELDDSVPDLESFDSEPADTGADEQQPSVDDQAAQDLRNNLWEKTKRRFSKKGLRGIEKETVERAAERKVTARSAQTVGKGVLKAGVRAGVAEGAELGGTAALLGTEAATGPVGWVAAVATLAAVFGKGVYKFVKNNRGKILAILALFFLIPATLFGLIAGKGFNIAPSTEEQKQQASAVSFIGGDSLSGRKMTQFTVASEKNRLDNMLSIIKRQVPDKAAQAERQIIEIKSLLGQLTELQGEQLKDLVAKIKEKEASLIKQFPELFPGGSCSETKEYIANGSIQIRAKADAELLPQGKVKNISGEIISVNPKICNLVLYLVKKGYKIGAITLANNHARNVKGTVRTSEHYLGRALDIAIVNGQGASGSNWFGVTNEIMQDLRDNRGVLGIWDLWGPHPLSVDNSRPVSKEISGHKDHLHISVK